MPWIKFPNQINDLLKLRQALQLAVPLSPSDLKDDGMYGEELLSVGVIRTKKSQAELQSLPFSSQPHRTSARGLRELFILLGCMAPTSGGVRLTSDGRAIARQTGLQMSPTERQLWIKLISQLEFPHSNYPQLSAGVTKTRPAHVLLAMLASGTLPAQGLAFAFSVRDESPQEVSSARTLANSWTGANAAQLASQIGTTESELRNNSKVFPGMLEQLGLIERRGGVAQILSDGLALLGVGKMPVARKKAPPRRRRPAARPVAGSTSKPWVPSPVDPADLAERARLQLIRNERANQDHHTAVIATNTWLRARRFRTTESDFDILARRQKLWLLIEVKSIGTASVRVQTMRAIGQLAYYSALSVPRAPKDVTLVQAVVYDRVPGDELALTVLKAQRIQSMWIDAGDLKFQSATFRKMVE